MSDANTFDDLVESFINYLLVECGLARNTILSYSRDLQAFISFLLLKKSPTLTAFVPIQLPASLSPKKNAASP